VFEKIIIGRMKMSTLAIVLISVLGGALTTGGTIWAVQSNHDKNTAQTTGVIEAIAKLESSIDQAEAKAIRNLTETDLLAVPCSAEFINGIDDKEGHGTLLCRELFCRMNRQGEGKGSEATECAAISNMLNSEIMVSECMKFWDDGTLVAGGNGINTNSKYAQCLSIYGKNK